MRGPVTACEPRRAAAIFSLAALLCVALLGCKQSVDLSGIQQLATATAAAAPSFGAIADDFYTSCTREYQWEYVEALHPNKLPPMDKVCAPSLAASRQWQATNTIVLAYIQTLGELAGGNDQNSDYGIPALLDSVNKIGATPLFTADQAAAISTLGQSLVTDIYNIRRRNEIAKYAPQADADLQHFIALLETGARDNYNQQLLNEQASFDQFYQTSILVARPGVEKMLAVHLQEDWRGYRQAISDKQSGITAYVGALDDISQAHTALVQSIQSNTPSDVKQIAQAYVNDLVPKIRALSAAFSPAAVSQ